MAGAIFRGDGGEGQGAEDVVADYGNRIFFHQRDVFEGGGMEDLRGRMLFEEVVEKKASLMSPRMGMICGGAVVVAVMVAFAEERSEWIS